MKYQKRRYQERIFDAFNKWKNTDGKLATIILPTGTGKTFSAAVCLSNFNKKVLWVAHREELIDQAYDTLSDVIENVCIDKEIAEYKASKDADIIVGSVQTLYRKRSHLKEFVPDLIVIDEYHHRSEKNVTYQGLIDRFPNARILGLTATPWRFSGDNLPLGEVLFNMDIGTAVSHKYLVPPKPEVLKTNVSLANVKTSMGDFAVKDLSEAVNVEERNKAIADKILEYVESGRQGILFGVDVNHAHAMYELLKGKCRAVEIYGDTDKEVRRINMEKIRNREIDCLVNNLIGTEGFDIPHLSFAVIARPTKSLGLYIQMSGRVLRTSPGKTDAIILDVFDKIKIRQSRITFIDMAIEGDLFGDNKRANSILDAELKTVPEGSGVGKNKDDGSFATKLEHFPVFMLKTIQDRWTTDDDFFPITSWAIAQNQRIITWTEEKVENKTIAKKKLYKFSEKPSILDCRSRKIQIYHEKFGSGYVIDDGVGTEIRVEFEPNSWIPKQKLYIPIEDLQRVEIIKELSQEVNKEKISRLFYFCFPDNVSEGRVIETVKKGWDLVIVSDTKMTKDTANNFIVNKARIGGVLPLVRSDANWKRGAASPKQKDLIEGFVRANKIGFDLDTENLTKGEASAIIEQMKWQGLINKKFGTLYKDKLLGYDISNEDI